MSGIPSTGMAWPLSQPTKKIRVYEQDTFPENPNVGDIWRDTSPSGLHIEKVTDTLLKAHGTPGAEVLFAGALASAHGSTSNWVSYWFTLDSGGNAYVTPTSWGNQYNPKSLFEAGWYWVADSLASNNLISQEIVLVNGKVPQGQEDGWSRTKQCFIQSDTGTPPRNVDEVYDEWDCYDVEVGMYGIDGVADVIPLNMNEGGLPLGFHRVGSLILDIDSAAPSATLNVFLVATEPVVGQPWPAETLYWPAPTNDPQDLDLTAAADAGNYGLSVGPRAANTMPDSTSGTASFIFYSHDVREDAEESWASIETDPNDHTRLIVKAWGPGNVPLARRWMAVGMWEFYHHPYVFVVRTDAQGIAYIDDGTEGLFNGPESNTWYQAYAKHPSPRHFFTGAP